MLKVTSKAKMEVISEGISRGVLVSGDSIMLVRIELKKGAKLAPHSHIHEQAGIVLKGKLKLIANGEEQILKKGDSYAVSSNMEHGAEALLDSIVIDAFYPPRKDFLKAGR